MGDDERSFRERVEEIRQRQDREQQSTDGEQSFRERVEEIRQRHEDDDATVERRLDDLEADIEELRDDLRTVERLLLQVTEEGGVDDGDDGAETRVYSNDS
jgi:TolA-binding protein